MYNIYKKFVDHMSQPQQPQPLPPNWQQLVTDDGRIYYQNNVTNTTQWARPLFPPPPPPPPPVQTTMTADPEYVRQYSIAVGLFNKLLQTFFNRNDIDMDIGKSRASIGVNPNMTPELQSEILRCLDNNELFYTLVDENNLTILGYIILTNKFSMLFNYISFLNETMQQKHGEPGRAKAQRIKTLVSDGLNVELQFILTHRVNGVDEDVHGGGGIVNMITRIIGELFPTFTLSERNAELLGYLILMRNYPSLNLPDRRVDFNIPHDYRPRWIAPPQRRGGKFETKRKLSKRNKLHKRKGSRKHHNRHRRGGAMTTLNPANF